MENKEVVTIEQTLAQLRSLKPDPYWQDSLRTLIVKEAVPKRTGGVLTFHWQPALIVALLLVLLAGETAVLTQESFPGDLLYPVKRNLEEFRLVFAGQDDKLLLQQNLTERRVAELKQIVQTRRYKSAQPAIAEVEASVARVSEQVSTISTRYQTLQQEGKDTTLLRQNLEQLVPVIEQKQVELQQIEQSLPEEAKPNLIKVQQSLQDLETQAKNILELPPKSTQDSSTSSPDTGNQNSPSVSAPLGEE
jgi:hypothetical protein